MNRFKLDHYGRFNDRHAAVVEVWDPLSAVDVSQMSELDRYECYKKLAAAVQSMLQIGYLDREEVDALIAFLKTLKY